TGLPLDSHDLWEERRGVFTFTAAAVCAGLKAAAMFARLVGEKDEARHYQAVAERMREAIREQLFSAELGRFVRGLTVRADARAEGVRPAAVRHDGAAQGGAVGHAVGRGHGPLLPGLLLLPQRAVRSHPGQPVGHLHALARAVVHPHGENDGGPGAGAATAALDRGPGAAQRRAGRAVPPGNRRTAVGGAADVVSCHVRVDRPGLSGTIRRDSGAGDAGARVAPAVLAGRRPPRPPPSRARAGTNLAEAVLGESGNEPSPAALAKSRNEPRVSRSTPTGDGAWRKCA